MEIKMHQFFVDDTQISGTVITITGSDVNHIRNVLRMKIGEEVRISAQSSKSYLCRISEIGEQFVQTEIVEEDVEGTELGARLYLFQGLPKADKMELIIQKAVELGAYAVIPVSMRNCVVKLDEKKVKGKRERWQQIAVSAAKQSKRSIVPEIFAPMSYRDAVAFAGQMDVNLVPYENAHGMTATQKALNEIRPGASVGIFIGPEGGFDPEEIEIAREKGMKPISLGRRILRTETAGFTALAILMYYLETEQEKNSAYGGNYGSISG